MPPDPEDDGDLGDFLDDDHAAIATFAHTYLDEDERESFIDQLMERRGYTRVQSWAPPQGSGSQRRPVLGGGQDGGPGGGGQGSRGGQRGSKRSPYFKR